MCCSLQITRDSDFPNWTPLGWGLEGCSPLCCNRMQTSTGWNVPTNQSHNGKVQREDKSMTFHRFKMENPLQTVNMVWTWHLAEFSSASRATLIWHRQRTTPPLLLCVWKRIHLIGQKNLVSLILCWETQSCAQAASALMKAQFHLRSLPLGRVSGEDEIIRGLTYETEDFYDVEVMLWASNNGLPSILLNKFLALKLGTISGDVQHLQFLVHTRRKTDCWFTSVEPLASRYRRVYWGLLCPQDKKRKINAKAAYPLKRSPPMLLGKGEAEILLPRRSWFSSSFFFTIWTY